MGLRYSGNICFFFQTENGTRDSVESRGIGDGRERRERERERERDNIYIYIYIYAIYIYIYNYVSVLYTHVTLPTKPLV